MSITYNLDIVDRAGNCYSISYDETSALPKKLIGYINADNPEPTAEVLFMYRSFLDDIFDDLYEQIFNYLPVNAAKLLQWIRQEFKNIENRTPFFRGNANYRKLTDFSAWLDSSGIDLNSVAEDDENLKNRLKDVFPEICMEYSKWDYLFEIKKISIADDVDSING